MTVEIGQEAPNFELKDPDGHPVSLASFRGETAVAVVFYPFTFTGICEGELCQLRDDIADFEAAGVQLLAISCDSKNSQKVWSEQKGYTFPLLSDFWPHGAVLALSATEAFRLARRLWRDSPGRRRAATAQ